MGYNSNILQRVLPPLTHPEHLSSTLVFSLMGSVLYIIVCPFFSILIWPSYYLFMVFRLLITPLVSSHFSYPVSSYSYNIWQILDKIIVHLLVYGLQLRWYHYLLGFFRNRVVPLLFSSPVVETASVV